MTRPLQTCVGVFVTLLLFHSPARSDITAEELRAKNKASQAAVLSVQARVEVNVELNPSQVPSQARNSPTTKKYLIDYARAGNKERTKNLEGPLGIRDVIRNYESGKGSVFVPKQEKQSVNTGTLDSEKKLFTHEIWLWTLFAMSDHFRHPLSELLARGEIKTLKPVVEDGRDNIYVDVRDSQGQKYEIWVDPAVNHLVRKMVFHWTGTTSGRTEREVLSFREVKPGVFFPERVRHTLFTNSSWLEKVEANLTNLRVNESLPAGMFQHVFPPGTMVTDVENGKLYTVGPAGQPTHVGTITSGSTFDSTERGAPALGTSTPPDADEDRWSWHHFLLIASGIILAAGVAAMIWKRRKRAAT